MSNDLGIEVAIVDSLDEANNFMRWLGERRPVLAWDIETTGLDPYRDEIRLSQFGDAKTGWAIPHQKWVGLIEEVMRKYDRPVVAHNMKFDSSMYEVQGIHVPRRQMHDTMTMCHLADNSGTKALKPAAVRWLGGWARAGQEELRDGMKRAKYNWATVPAEFEPYWTYGALDTVITARLAEKLWPLVQPWRKAYEREIAITWTLLDMEKRGIRIDVEYCEDMFQWLSGEHDEICARWPGINLHSTNDVAKVLTDDGIKLTARTEKGALTLDDVTLEMIDHPIATDVLAARYRKKLFGTYFGPFLERQVGGFLHPNIRPLGAEKHGRMSIGAPALQGVPRTNAVRGAMIPREGNKLLLCDYEAQEMRMLVHYTQDPGLLQALRDEVDLHQYAASEIYGVDFDAVTKAQRTTAKWTGFSKVYGAGPPRIAATAGIPLDQAAAFLKRYDRKFPGVVRFQAQVQRAIRQRQEGGWGWVETWGGRRLQVRASEAYKGVNYIISGGCADLTKEAMLRMEKAGVGEYMVLPIHDEVIFDVPADSLEEARVTIRECMEYDDLSVPLTTEQKVVDCWGDAYPAVVDLAVRRSRKATHTSASAEQTARAAAAWSVDDTEARNLTRGPNTQLAQAESAEVCPKCHQSPNSRRTKMTNYEGPRCEECGQPIMLKRDNDEGLEAWKRGQRATAERKQQESETPTLRKTDQPAKSHLHAAASAARRPCEDCGQVASGRTRQSYTGPRCSTCGEPNPVKRGPEPASPLIVEDELAAEAKRMRAVQARGRQGVREDG